MDLLLTSDQYNKGILIHDIGDADNDLITFTNENYEDEKYYLFYRMNSFHIGKLNNGSYDTALQFTKLLLNYEEKRFIFQRSIYQRLFTA